MNLLNALFLLLIAFVVCDDAPIAQIQNGKIKGRKYTARSGIDFYAFLEVPFAKPPVGKLRFKAPQPAEHWDGILDCTKNTKICYQMGSDSSKESDDCLYLNVYSPLLPGTNASLPVIYYLFGGGFVQGSSTFDTNGPHYFMEHDVVIITMNYRVGPFGFLSTGDLTIPGNYGLKDQLMGLKWVRDNIHVFGGDPNKVTVFGSSAGSASSTYHVISKQSTGLFRAAMGESGTALCPWAYQRAHKSVAYQLAKQIDASFNESSTTKELLQFLMGVPAKDIDSVSDKIHIGYSDQMAQGYFYAPVVEPEHEEAFITEEMFTSIETGRVNKVPLLLGLASEEQLNRVSGGIDNFRKNMATIDANLTIIVPLNLHLPDELRETVAKEIREIYTTELWQNDDAASVKQFSDTCFSRPLIKHIELHAQYADTYLFQFSYHGNITNNNLYVEGAGRVHHSEYSTYIWARGGNDNIMDYPEDDVKASKRYVKLLTNFATYLNPTPEVDDSLQNIIWPKVQPGEYQYLDIDRNLTIQRDPKSDSYRKWVALYESRGVKPFETF